MPCEGTFAVSHCKIASRSAHSCTGAARALWTYMCDRRHYLIPLTVIHSSFSLDRDFNANEYGRTQPTPFYPLAVATAFPG